MSDASGAIRFALSQIGKPYLWGATGPDSYDCSGLLQTAYSKGSGISIPRTTYAMIDDPTLQVVNRNQLQPGDLVFPSREHVQMYLGGGKVIEAPRTGLNVRITALGDFMTGRRITTPASGDWSGVSPISDTNPVTNADLTGLLLPTASDFAQGIGTGLTNFAATVIARFTGWFVWAGMAILGLVLVIVGIYLTFVTKPVLKIAKAVT